MLAHVPSCMAVYSLAHHRRHEPQSADFPNACGGRNTGRKVTMVVLGSLVDSLNVSTVTL
jgi:hypothetical protein